MPLFLKRTFDEDIELGMWLMTEELDYFKSRTLLHKEEENEIQDLNHRKLKEWYCSRYLLHLMSGRESRGACIKDPHGKPYLKDSNYHISMSHSHAMCGVVANKKNIGVDVQLIVPKIDRIHHKFMHENEILALGHHNRLEKMHVYWGAKESLYKIYGKREIEFKKHLFINEFEYNEEEINIYGSINKGGFNNKYQGKAFRVDDYIVTFLTEF